MVHDLFNALYILSNDAELLQNEAALILVFH
jgi:hypothetical protein